MKRACSVMLLLVSLWGLSGVRLSDAATVNVTACTPAALTTAHTTATAGDTLQFPTCTSGTWNGTSTITKNNITLQGNGIANTILHRADAFAGDFLANPMIAVSGTTGFRFKDIYMHGFQDTTTLGDSCGGAPYNDAGLGMEGDNLDFRIYNSKFTDFSQPIYLLGNPTVQRGVIDHNTFTDNLGGTCYSYAVGVVGTGVYPALDLGSATNVFVENNTFTGGKTAVYGNNGARYVARYNTLTGMNMCANFIDTHGKEAFPTGHGTRQIEIYNNQITPGSGSCLWIGVGLGAGDGAVFNNTVTGYAHPYRIHNINTDPPISCGASTPQTELINSLYFWNNFIGATPLTNSNLENMCPTTLILNTHYFFVDRTTIGYTPYTYPHPLVGGAGPTFSMTATPRYTLSGGTVSIAWTAPVGATSCDSDMTLGTDAPWTALSSATLLAGGGYTTAARTVKSTYRITCTDGTTPTVQTATVYLQAVVDRVVSLLLNEGSGTTSQDSSGLENAATLNAVTWSTTAQSGGQSLLFNSTTDSASVPALDIRSTAGSILLWGRPTSFAASPPQYFVGHDSVPGSFLSTIQLYTSATDGVLKLGMGNNHVLNTAVTTLNPNTWVHLALTWNETTPAGTGTYAVYMNGIPTAVATGTYAGLTAIGSTFDIGNDGSSAHDEGFAGQIDNVMVYTRALTGSEIAAVVSGGAATVPAAPTNLRIVSP